MAVPVGALLPVDRSAPESGACSGPQQVRKSSRYIDRCHSERCYGCVVGFGSLVQGVVCFKRDDSSACNYVLRQNRHRFFIKTLKRHWHGGCLKM
ncbi:hypothetical protein KUL72_30395 [Bradyrhizobium arachidis]|uniref:hypothetical protein n=1 Tax=Bradyrhizobium arachidis TaxID=858423 RepID=UPI0021631D7C|nr:hypothetical protein [Bradyrhizobium arachidis]UVO35681.1 hypothetical protein KUL72_30395 [Bradyrhizobium arachidis]